jgi:hypothetical protein
VLRLVQARSALGWVGTHLIPSPRRSYGSVEMRDLMESSFLMLSFWNSLANAPQSALHTDLLRSHISSAS